MQTIFETSKQKMKKLMAGFAILMVLVIASPSQAQISGTTDIEIDFPPLLILFYYSTVDLTISAANLQAAVLTPNVNPVDRGTFNGVTSGFTEDLAIDSSTNFSSTVTLTLNNAWAVRSVGPLLGQVQIDLDFPVNTLTHTGVPANTIGLGNILTTEDAGPSGPANPVVFDHQGLGNPVTGDITIDLNLSNAGLSGTYNGGSYRVTATSI
jgi:hypothetical protein